MLVKVAGGKKPKPTAQSIGPGEGIATRQIAILDKEEIAHSLLQTKKETNTLNRDNVKLRTQNKNMTTLVESLYDDLDTY